MEDKTDYTLDALCGLFFRHAEMFEENLKDDITRFQKNFPESELPDHFKDIFNISKALHVLATEIQKLKTSIVK